ncbi:MAG: response regulator [Cyanobacteria bacterium KgW148]|nr:response regulator [Cyanobacteria bacterium KgW148]
MLPPLDQYAILIVDDNDMNREILQRHLRRQGYRQIVTAQSGEQALEQVNQQSFDLILLDVMMPEMNGYEVLEQLKSQEQHRSIPVIMISAMEETDSVVRCIELGAEDYLTKPFDPMILKARVGVCLERKFLTDRQRDYLRELETTAYLDPVTRLPNRRALEGYFQAIPAGEDFTIASLGIDYFGQYRDQMGKSSAETLLKQISSILQSNLAPEQNLAYDWGAEFIVLLPHCPQASALEWAETLKTKIAEAKIPHPCSPVSTYVTISMGIVTTADRGSSPWELIAQSDRELDKAKQEGNYIASQLLTGTTYDQS